MKKISISFFVALFLLISGFVMAQTGSNTDQNSPKVYLWKTSANLGSSLLWGDAASSDNPFSRWFSPESQLTAGLTLNRKLTNTFWLQASVQKGWFYGERSKWTGDVYHPIVTSKTSFIDYHLGLNVDFTSLFGFKPDRLITVYGFGGIGLVQYNAESFADAVSYDVVKDNAIIIPWGGGVRLRLNERWSIYGESNFRNTLVDDIDAYVGGGTDVNDIYSITGFGLTYDFGVKREKKPKIIVSPVKPDTTLAEAPVPVDILFNTNLPTEIVSNASYDVSSSIDLGALSTKAAYLITIPEDFYITNVKVEGATVQQDLNIIKITWDALISDKQTISYNLATGGLEKEQYIIASSIEYSENNEHKVKFFNNRLNVNVAVVATNNQKPNDNIGEVISTDNQTTTSVGKNQGNESKPTLQTPVLEYRVQVAAVYGGTTSIKMLNKKYGLTEEIYEDLSKTSNKYTVGKFSSYGEAIRSSALTKVPGSYVVVFKDGKYIGLLEQTNPDVMDQNGIYPEGETFKIQIAASKGRTYSIAKLAYKYGVAESDITEDEIAGWYQYTLGKFRSTEESMEMLKQIKSKLPQAYLVKFMNGKRVPR